MTATYTWDVFSSLDGYGSYDTASTADWGGYWGKQGPSSLRIASRSSARTSAWCSEPIPSATSWTCWVDHEGNTGVGDPWVGRMRNIADDGHFEHAQRTAGLAGRHRRTGDAADVVARLKADSAVPFALMAASRSNWALMAAGLVDLIQVSVFPVITGRTGVHPIFGGAGDFDLELLESRLLDGRIQELIYRPSAHP